MGGGGLSAAQGRDFHTVRWPNVYDLSQLRRAMLRGWRGRETHSLTVEIRLPVAGFPGWGVFAVLEGSGCAFLQVCRPRNHTQGGLGVRNPGRLRMGEHRQGPRERQRGAEGLQRSPRPRRGGRAGVRLCPALQPAFVFQSPKQPMPSCLAGLGPHLLNRDLRPHGPLL